MGELQAAKQTNREKKEFLWLKKKTSPILGFNFVCLEDWWACKQLACLTAAEESCSQRNKLCLSFFCGMRKNTIFCGTCFFSFYKGKKEFLWFPTCVITHCFAPLLSTCFPSFPPRGKRRLEFCLQQQCAIRQSLRASALLHSAGPLLLV